MKHARLTPRETLSMSRDLISDRIRAHGVRFIARKTGLSHMLVSRYVNRTGANDALTHYILADAVDRPINE